MIYLCSYLFIIIIIIIEKEGANEFRYVWIVRKGRKY